MSTKVKNPITRTSTIKLHVHMDKDNVPLAIEWEGEDAENKEKKPCKSFMLSLWDHMEGNTLRIDLWSKDMPIDEMDHFFVQSIMTMGDTYALATGRKELGEDFRKFGEEFAKKITKEREKQNN